MSGPALLLADGLIGSAMPLPSATANGGIHFFGSAGASVADGSGLDG